MLHNEDPYYFLNESIFNCSSISATSNSTKIKFYTLTREST